MRSQPTVGTESLGKEYRCAKLSPAMVLTNRVSIIKNIPFEWLVGVRYTRAGRRSGRNSFISFISLISMAGIALGVAALIVVLSVMNGFQKDVRDRMLSVLSHIEVFDASGAMRDWKLTAREAFQNPEVRGAAPYVEHQIGRAHV